MSLGTVKETFMEEKTTELNVPVESGLRGKGYWSIQYKSYASLNRNFQKSRLPSFTSFRQLSALNDTQWLKYPHLLSNKRGSVARQPPHD